MKAVVLRFVFGLLAIWGISAIIIVFVKPAKADDFHFHIVGVTEVQVTDHSKYIVDHRFGGLCFYETSSSVGIYVNKFDGIQCERMLKGAE